MEGRGDSIYKSRWPEVSRSRFCAVSIFCPPTNILRIERKVCNRQFRRSNARSVDRVSFAIRPLVFLPCSPYLRLLMGSVCNRILMRRFSLCIPFDYHEAAKRSCFPSCKKGDGKVSKPLVPIIKILSAGRWSIIFDFFFSKNKIPSLEYKSVFF